MGGLWHIVEQGEWLTKIAAKYKISDWKTKIWDDPNNRDLIQRRDPNVLHPGDRIFIPANSEKELPCGTGRTHKFVLRKAYDEFNLRLLDHDDKPIRNTAYTLSVGDQTFQGKTDNNGEIHQRRIDPSGDHRGILKLPDVGLQFMIGVGDLNPTKETGEKDHPQYDNGISGLLMRLRNLGYGPENVTQDISTENDLSSEDRNAILTFQHIEMKRSDGRLTSKLDSETRDAILTKYGI